MRQCHLLLACTLFACVACAACATMTPYQPKAFTGGYTDRQLAPDTYLVTVEVNGFTSAATAYEYFHRRASELCAPLTYEVLDSNTDAKLGAIVTSSFVGVVKKPEIFGRIRCRQ